jgi:hypothetical protein
MVMPTSAPSAPPEQTRPRATLAPFQPRFIRLRDAPCYLGMDKNRFNREVRPSSPRSPSARRESPSIALTSTHGRMTIRAAMGIPRLNLKGESHGKPKNVWSHQTRWDLAHRFERLCQNVRLRQPVYFF